MIDPQTGAVLSLGNAVYPSASETLLPMTGRTWQVVVENGPLRTYKGDLEGWSILLMYSAGELRTVELAAKLPGDSGWGKWNESAERQRNQIHKEELRRLFGDPSGPSYVLPWGQVSAAHDDHTGDSVIVVRYR
jgi:hypothetical protein